MFKIGDIKTENTKQYGTFNYVCIGFINVLYGKNEELKKRLEKTINKEEFDKVSDEFNEKCYNWSMKYHPHKYFSASIVYPPNKDEDWKYYVFVPLLSANKDWFKNNKDCEYFKQVGNHNQKELPVGVTEKELKKWINESDFVLND